MKTIIFNEKKYIDALNKLQFESMKILKDNSKSIELSQLVPTKDGWSVIIFYITNH